MDEYIPLGTTSDSQLAFNKEHDLTNNLSNLILRVALRSLLIFRYFCDTFLKRLYSYKTIRIMRLQCHTKL